MVKMVLENVSVEPTKALIFFRGWRRMVCLRTMSGLIMLWQRCWGRKIVSIGFGNLLMR